MTLATIPDVVLVDGRRFLRARVAKPYVGVVAQYREDKPRDSGHLYLLTNGRITVPHCDRWNPDAGIASLMLHGLVDDRRLTAKLATAAAAGWWVASRTALPAADVFAITAVIVLLRRRLAAKGGSPAAPSAPPPPPNGTYCVCSTCGRWGREEWQHACGEDPRTGGWCATPDEVCALEGWR